MRDGRLRASLSSTYLDLIEGRKAELLRGIVLPVLLFSLLAVCAPESPLPLGEGQGEGMMGGTSKTALAIRAACLAPEKLFERKMFVTGKVRELTPEGADISITEQEFPKDFQSPVL